MNRKFVFLVLISILISSSLGACGKTIAATNYAKPVHWLSAPTAVDKPVDVFYLYPTSWQKINQSDPNICEIDNPMMLKGAQLAYSRQVTAFEPIANIFAPFYRQDDAVYTTSLPQEEQAKIVGGIPKTDAMAAFDYYIKNFNNGRPYFLVGHSQGSIVMKLILSEYMKENPKVYARMIAAYVIGSPITPEYLAENPHLKFAEGPDDTGVIISYNTEATTVEGKNPVLIPGSLAINPITWTRDETPATGGQNLGSIIINQDRTVALDKDGDFLLVKNYADARVDKARGVIICSICNVEKLAPGNAFSGKGVFHSFDYSFYYFNIRENAENRARIFLNN